MKDLRHPNIIQLVDSFIEVIENERKENEPVWSPEKTNAYLHIIMEYADCGDLYKVIAIFAFVT